MFWCFINIKLIIHSKIKNIYIVISIHLQFPSAKHISYFEERGKTNSCWATVAYIEDCILLLSKSMRTSNCLVTHIHKNIIFCVQHKTEINKGLGQHLQVHLNKLECHSLSSLNLWFF